MGLGHLGTGDPSKSVAAEKIGGAFEGPQLVYPTGYLPVQFDTPIKHLPFVVKLKLHFANSCCAIETPFCAFRVSHDLVFEHSGMFTSQNVVESTHHGEQKHTGTTTG